MRTHLPSIRAAHLATISLLLLLSVMVSCYVCEATWGAAGEAVWLCDRVASRAMSSLSETAEALLQFLQELRGQNSGDMIAVAAVRALGRWDTHL